jgi:hypothetical protein
VCCRSSILTGGGEGGAISCVREKAWPSINHSILSVLSIKGRDVASLVSGYVVEGEEGAIRG